MERVRVAPGILPPTMSTTPNSPRVWAKVKTMPVTTPETESGKITFAKVRSFETPSDIDAASKRASTAENDAAKGCTANGRLYRTDPMTRPWKVNAKVWPVIEDHQRPNGLRCPRASST